MAKENKSILEEALLDVKKIQEALNANTKEILRSIAKEEIDGLVKESLNEEDFEEEDVDSTESELEPVATGGEEAGDESGEDTDLVAVATGDESGEGDAEFPSSEVGEPELTGDETGMDTDVSLGDEIDMTSASDDDVIAVYKKLTGEDEIEVVGNDIHLTVSEPGEYVIKNASAGTTAPAAPSAEMGIGAEDDLEPVATGEEGAEDEVNYEIELGDAPATGDESSEEGEIEEYGDEHQVSVADALGNEGEEEETIAEAIPVGNAQARRVPGKATPIKGAGAKALEESVSKTANLLKETTEKYNKILNESKELKKENDEFRTSLKKFRNMLVETVVFNSNLTYVTKLFMEHSTTKDEKKSILGRFDSEVSNLKESKKLYKTIAAELSTRKTITESVDKKLNVEVLSSTSRQLNESTAYVDKDTARIMDLIKRVENK